MPGFSSFTTDFRSLSKLIIYADFNDKDRCGELHSSKFDTFNTLGVTVAINGYQGGDSGHRGRTYLSFEDLCSTDIDALRWAADKMEDLKNKVRVPESEGGKGCRTV